MLTIGEDQFSPSVRQTVCLTLIQLPHTPHCLAAQLFYPLHCQPHLRRDLFQASGPNQKWVADFTYIWTAEGWLYAAAVMDLYSRRIVGWSMSDTMQAKMVSDALLMALWRRGKPSSLMHHSDQGSQYTSDDFQQLLCGSGDILLAQQYV